MSNDAVFGRDDAPAMTLEQFAAAVRTMKVAEVPHDKLGDVIDIIEHLREQALSLHADNVRAANELNERHAFLTKREAELALRQRAVNAVLKHEPKRRFYFWR